jgi:hypothetical protein
MDTWKFLAAALASVSLAACDMPASESRVAGASVVATSGVTHNWTVHEDGAYGYASGKGGPGAPAAAPPVATFRYLGLIDGEYQIGVDDASGTIASCANPCTNIRYIQEGETIQRAAYDPQSAIGAAFADAFSGRLEVYQLPPPEMEQVTLATPAPDSGLQPPPGDEPQPLPPGASPAATPSSSGQGPDR